MKFTFAEQIRTILRRRGWSVEKLAAALGTSKQNLNQQLLRDNFKEADARRIAAALGYDMEITLIPRAEEADARDAINTREASDRQEEDAPRRGENAAADPSTETGRPQG